MALKRKGKIALIVTIAVSSVLVVAAGCYIAYGFSHLARNGETEKYLATAIGTKAYLEENEITINKHKFTYYNVKAADDGGWVLVDSTSYIINTDLQFGFRYKNATYVDITSYGEDAKDPHPMRETDAYPGYSNYQVFGGFKLTIKESLDSVSNINIGVLMHWC